MDFINPIRYVFYMESGKLLGWLYLKLPFSLKYSLKLAYLSGRYKKEAKTLLIRDTF